MDDGQDANASDTSQSSAPDQQLPPPDDAADLARVAHLVARAGLPLTMAEIADLVKEERYDRAGFERMRAMLAAEDETAHTFQAARVMRRPSDLSTAPAAGATSPTKVAAQDGDPSEPGREARP